MAILTTKQIEDLAIMLVDTVLQDRSRTKAESLTLCHNIRYAVEVWADTYSETSEPGEETCPGCDNWNYECACIDKGED